MGAEGKNRVETETTVAVHSVAMMVPVTIALTVIRPTTIVVIISMTIAANHIPAPAVAARWPRTIHTATIAHVVVDDRRVPLSIGAPIASE